MSLALEPLTLESFKPFGDYIGPESGGESANQGRAFKRSHLTSLVNTRDQALANVATFRVMSKSLPFSLRLLEKHPCSSQLFIPFASNSKYLVIVAHDLNDAPDLSTLKGFISETNAGFNYKPGIWHSPMVAIGEGYIDFVSLTYEHGNDPLNTVEYEISEIQVDVSRYNET